MTSERWATFDCYGTLIDWNRGVGDAMEALWPGSNRGHLLGLYHSVEPLVQQDQAIPYVEVLARALQSIAEIESRPLQASQRYALAISLPDWPAFPETARVLRALREHGWKLGILSNTDPDLLAASLLQIGVDVDLVITAAEAGSYKPAHAHWTRFFEMSNADPTRHVHVAASLFHDIRPADELGIRAVWINRLNERSDLPRVAELPDLTQLPDVLENLDLQESNKR